MKKVLLSLIFSASIGFAANAQSNIAIGATCPDFTFKDSKGVNHNLYALCNQGKYVVVDFFAYWCGPCMATAPTIEDFYEKYGCNSGNVVVLGNESDAAGTYANLYSFHQGAGTDTMHTYPAGPGTWGSNAANANAYGVGAYPTVILIGPDKKMIANDIWPIPNVAAIEAKFPSGALTPMACAPAAIKNNINENFSLSLNPNPTTAYTNLSFNLDNTSDVTVQLTDISGKLIINQTYSNLNSGSQNIKISTNNIQAGIYLVKIVANNQTSVAKKLTIQ